MKYKDIVIVTGGAGFIGSNYLNKYVPRMKERLFVNVDKLTYAGKLSNLSVAKAPNYAFEKVDICDMKALRKVFKKYHPTAVMHFAAESHVDLSIKDPDIFIRTNVLGTHNLLLLAREFKVRRFHQVSTDEVYGALESRAGSFSEDSPLQPRNPYSASKAAADLLVRSYSETFGLKTVITRSCNNYGPNQDTSKIIPSFLTKLFAGRPVPLYDRGQHIREWIYVEDCVDALHLAFTKGKSGETYNIGSGQELTNLELTQLLLALTKRDSSFIRSVPNRLGHDFRYSLDSRKMRRLGWKPKVSLQEGLLRTAEALNNHEK